VSALNTSDLALSVFGSLSADNLFRPPKIAGLVLLHWSAAVHTDSVLKILSINL
jgi:hypothetical protein